MLKNPSFVFSLPFGCFFCSSHSTDDIHIHYIYKAYLINAPHAAHWPKAHNIYHSLHMALVRKTGPPVAKTPSPSQRVPHKILKNG